MTSRVSEVEMLEILKARGGKDPVDRWKVDRIGDSIRIIKQRTDGVLYPPGAAVESWRKDSKGAWKLSFSA